MIKNYAEAIEWYNKAIALDPQSAEYFSKRGIAKHCLFDYEGAMKDYTKAIELDPSFGQAYLYRAIIYFSWGRQQEACAELRAARKLGVDDVYKAIQIECP